MASLKGTSVILAVLCFVLSASAAGNPPFPKVKDFNLEFYETEVQITNINEKYVGIANEYYDSGTPKGKLQLTQFGKTQSIFYNNDTDEITFVDEDGICSSTDIATSQYDYFSIYYGWLNKDPLVIGPSAPLWYANTRDSKEIDYEGRVRIRGIECDAYSLTILGDKDQIGLTFYFAADGWTTPYQMEGMRVPIRIEAIGNSSRGNENNIMMVVNMTSDFMYFKPTIRDWNVFLPPLGLGCKLKKATRTMPPMPKVFRYYAEMFDNLVTDSENPQYTYDVENQEVWFDQKHTMARLDKYSKSGSVSELYDFNTGVTYRLENRRSCTIKPLRNSFFEGVNDNLVGHLKDPQEVLNLDGETFYYMGKRLMRGIFCDTFENLQEDVTFMKKSLSKLVITIFYSLEDYNIRNDGEDMNQVPIYYMVKGYDKDTKKVVIDLLYNIFEFSDVVWPHMYSTFGLERCFPSLKDKSYFVMMLNVEEKLAAIMEDKDDLIIELIKGQITKYAKVSDKRIPMLSADYKSSGVTVTGLILDRPPALKQFYKEFTGDVTVYDKKMKMVVEANTPEKCAYACVDKGDECLGFHMCKATCWLKHKSIFDKPDKDDPPYHFGEDCDTYLRATDDSTNNEAYLVDALKNLEEAVLNQKVKIAFAIDEKTDKIVPIEQIAIGDGPYTGIGQDKPYDIVINFAKLDETDSTTQKMEYVDNVNECFKACRDAESTACASFSFCPKANNKQCLLTSTLYVDRKHNPDGTKDDNTCYIYSLKYTDLYVPYPGRVSLIGGDDVYTGVTTLEDCARKCHEDTKVKCRGFEFCRSGKTCVLHSRHILDLSPGEVTTDKSKTQTCVHYAAKFSTDYDDMGFTLVDDPSDQRVALSLEECAKVCSEELKSKCKSFNYCPASQPFSTDSTCSLSTKLIKDNGVTTTVKDKCHHYEKKTVDDWRKPDKSAIPVASGYTTKGFTGLVIGMLALGLIVGAIGFVGYSYYRSRSGGDGMTVRFMKQPT